MEYWNGKGQLTTKAAILTALYPSSGSVEKAHKNPKLERFRKVQNAYYRLFNDGDSNGRLLGVYSYEIKFAPWQSLEYRKTIWKHVGETADKALEKAIVEAWKEQYNTTLLVGDK